jgi:hypothetical protein
MRRRRLRGGAMRGGAARGGGRASVGRAGAGSSPLQTTPLHVALSSAIIVHLAREKVVDRLALTDVLDRVRTHPNSSVNSFHP